MAQHNIVGVLQGSSVIFLEYVIFSLAPRSTWNLSHAQLRCPFLIHHPYSNSPQTLLTSSTFEQRFPFTYLLQVTSKLISNMALTTAISDFISSIYELFATFFSTLFHLIST